MVKLIATWRVWIAALALASVSVHALSIAPNRLGGASLASGGVTAGTAFVAPQRGAAPRLRPPLAITTARRGAHTQLSTSATSGDDGGRGDANVRARVRSTLTRISRKVRGGGGVSKREQFRKKFVSLAVAFSTLFFISTGRHADTLQAPGSAASLSPAATSASSVVARGGGSTTTPRSGVLESITSMAKGRGSRSSPVSPVDRTIVESWDEIRGGGGSAKVATNEKGLHEHTHHTFREAIAELREYMRGPKADTLVLLFATAVITPLCKMAGTSPILGFLASGMLLGPNGFGVISDLHTTETLAELGIVFFLFEMGIELSVERLKSMKKDVFGLGLSQYTITAVVLGLAAKYFGGMSGPASVVVGGALSLSSSAFVLQLVKDKKELATRFGKASFGVLLLQDLAVVPLLVATPILAGSGSLAGALGGAVVKAAMALSGIALAGRFALNPLFKLVAAANSQEAFLGLILGTALGMSFLTEGLGLSNTLGAFLAGVLLSETKYRYQVEADIAPFRGILLGLFFVTVGFEIDVHLIANNLPVVSAIVAGILGLKAGILTMLCKAFGIKGGTAIRTGLVLSQGGEFAFVAFGLAKSLGILDPATTKMLLTCVSLTMALTPFLDEMGGKIAKKMEEGTDFTHYMGQDEEAQEITDAEDSEFVVVVGYGAVGKVVCDLLDKKFIKYVGMEKDPKKAIQARNKGLPVFFGDVGRKEVAEAFHVDKSKAVIVCIADQAEATRAAIALRRMYPDKKIFARAKDADHAKRLQTTLDVAAMVPILPEDNLLLTLPFGGAVLRSLGAPAEEVNYILAEKRMELLSGKQLEKFEEETVLAQLGVEKPAEEDGGGGAAGEGAGASAGVETDAERGAAVAAASTMSMLKQVVEANISPEHKKREVEAAEPEGGAAEGGGDPETETKPL